MGWAPWTIDVCCPSMKTDFFYNYLTENLEFERFGAHTHARTLPSTQTPTRMRTRPDKSLAPLEPVSLCVTIGPVCYKSLHVAIQFKSRWTPQFKYILPPTFKSQRFKAESVSQKLVYHM